MEQVNRNYPRGIIIIAILMFLFGLAEILTGFTHQFFGLSTSESTNSTYLGAAIGALYVMAGGFILIMKRWAAVLAILALAADVFGRVAMVVAGFYPISTFKQMFSIVAGTLIAVAFGTYIGFNWKSFR
jgi:hypothetical protein